jgi:hypothetical protein
VTYQLTLKDHVKGVAKLEYYRAGNLYYRTATGLLFPVPIADAGEATFSAEEKGLLLMRYIRKHLQAMESKP